MGTKYGPIEEIVELLNDAMEMARDWVESESVAEDRLYALEERYDELIQKGEQ